MCFVSQGQDGLIITINYYIFISVFVHRYFRLCSSPHKEDSMLGHWYRNFGYVFKEIIYKVFNLLSKLSCILCCRRVYLNPSFSILVTPTILFCFKYNVSNHIIRDWQFFTLFFILEILAFYHTREEK